MIVVDSSVWIDYFSGKQNRESDILDAMLGQEALLIGDLILIEILQGFRSDKDFRQASGLLKEFPVVPMLGPELAIQSAINFRKLRKRGITVRKTIDIMIGTYCIANSQPLLFSDRDFQPMVTHLGLKLI